MDVLGPRSQTLGTWLAFLLAASWILYELRKDDQLPTGATVSSKLLPILLIATLLITAALHVIAAVINRRKPKAPESKPQGVDPMKHKEIADNLSECQSQLRLQIDEVNRIKLDYNGQLDIARQQWDKERNRVSELEQQLRVSRETTTELLNRFSTPKGTFCFLQR